MPFKSDAQRKYLFANNPALAKKYAAETPANIKLPQKVEKAPKISKFHVKQIKGIKPLKWKI